MLPGSGKLLITGNLRKVMEESARAALSYGAEGVGLCRTERMFFAPDRRFAMQCALLAVEDEDRGYWLGQLETAQRDDFREMFEAMAGRPVTIRLLDRALEEVMPRDEATLGAIGEALDLDATVQQVLLELEGDQ